MRRDAYVFDIDGTLSDPAHRRHHVEGPKKNWPAFFEGCADDPPIRAMLRIAHDLSKTSVPLVYCTGRPRTYAAQTVQWLRRNNLDPWFLYMRAEGDFRDDTLVKSELMDRILADGFDPILVFDDRNKVVEMWRARGLVCAHVAEGDF